MSKTDKDDNINRTKTLSIRFTPEEYEDVCELAYRTRNQMAAMMRELVLKFVEKKRKEGILD